MKLGNFCPYSELIITIAWNLEVRKYCILTQVNNAALSLTSLLRM